MPALIWCSLVAGAFLLTHAYLGIRHDNVLYLGQAFRHLYPEIFSGDVFFRYGSQDDYSVFSRLYAGLIEHFGVASASLVLVVLGQIAFLLASYALVRRLMRPGERLWPMLFVVCSPGLYGPYSLLRIAEPFVTPRPLVEALTLAALALALGSRAWRGLVVLLAAALLHPLMAFAGMLCWWALLFLQDRRWLALAGLALIPVFAGWAGVAPFTMLVTRFDPEWLAVLVDSNWHLFLLDWSRPDVSLIAVDVAVLIIAARMEPKALALSARAALAAGAAGLLITLIGADLLDNVFLTSLQAWRSLWVVHWLAAAATPLIAARYWREGAWERLLAGLVVFSFLMRGNDAGLASAVALGAMLLVRLRPVVDPRLVNVVLGLLALAVVAKTGITLWHEGHIAYALFLDPHTQLVLRIVCKPLLILAVAALAFWLYGKGRHRAAAAVSVVVLVAGLLGWDQRSNWVRYAESAPPGSHPFAKIVQPQEEVFWQNQTLGPWLLLKRKDYASTMQTAGQMFSRATALELKRRREALAPLEFQADLCDLMNHLNNHHDSCQPDTALVAEVCKQAPDLDYMVLETRLAVPPKATWVPPIDMTGLVKENYLYDCRSFRASQ